MTALRPALLAVLALVGFDLGRAHPALALAVFAVLIALAVVLAVRARRATVRADAAEDALDAVLADSFGLPCIRIDGPQAGGTFTAVNRAAADRWGYDPETLTSRPYAAFVGSDPAATLAVARASDAGGTYAGHVNAYVAGPRHATPGALLWQRWYQIGPRHAVAVPIDGEITAREAARVAQRGAARLRSLVRTEFDQLLDTHAASGAPGTDGP